MSSSRLQLIVDLAYDSLRQKINGGRIIVENEASLQLQLASIIKTLGEVYEHNREEYFSIELEKPVSLSKALSKSGTKKAKIDLFMSFVNAATGHAESCAIELKYFKKKNQREPNNRYDVFLDIANLERYGAFAQQCYLIVGTDHPHYVSQKQYSPQTADFDFRDGRRYLAGTALAYRTSIPYGEPVTLLGNYEFKWDRVDRGHSFLKLPVKPMKDRASLI